MNGMLPEKVFSIENLNEIDKNYNIELKNKWKFIIGNKNAYPNYYGIYKDEASGNYIVYYNEQNGITQKIYIGSSERKACNVIWNLFLEKVYKSEDSLKLQISKKFINKNHPNNIKFYLKILLISVLCIVGFLIVVKLIGFFDFIDYLIDVK